MNVKPILFSAPMIRALLAGTKTQTRRTVKPQPDAIWGVEHTDSGEVSIRCPYGQPGDLLWVRETFRGAAGYDESPPSRWGNKPIWYTADGEPDKSAWWHLSYRSRPGIHMPRWASRLTLRITEVRVERLQRITRGDAMDEGCPFSNMADGPDPREWYADLWNAINGPDSWPANPWVWALTFEVIQSNVDQVVPKFMDDIPGHVLASAGF